jgi:lambda repressor-like predicted transcriptional regulator
VIDPLNGPAYLFGAQSSGLPSPGDFRQTVVSSAAQALGMNVQDVQTALQNGSSLADLAQQQGVSSDALVSAVAQGIQSLGASTGGLPGAPDVTQMAQRIVDRKGGIGGHHHHRASGGGSDPDGDGDVDKGSGSDSDSSSSSPFAIVSNALGMSQNDLLAALESGTSLTDLLTQNGVTQQSLASALGGGGLIDTTA